jgi:arylsulfatase A-like enzyme
MTAIHNYFEITLKAVFMGSVIGFIIGLVLSIINMTAHGYFEHNLYNLALFDLQYNLTKYTIISVICAIIALAAVLIIIQAYRYLIHNRKGSHKTFGFLSEIIGSKLSSGIGACALALVIILNIFTFIYTRAQTGEGPNIVLISIDTLRADHLGSYGYERNTSPNIDKLAEKGVLFENAYSQAPWTLPSVATFFTSLYPVEHSATSITRKLPDQITTLSEYLKNNFYTTTAVVSNLVLGEKSGISQGFYTYDMKPAGRAKNISSHKVTKMGLNYLNKNRDEKFFLWLHYMDPHGRYLRHQEFDYNTDYSGFLDDKLSPRILNPILDVLSEEDMSYVIDRYDGEISFTDFYIGKLLDALDEYGLSDNTIIVLTADHGEEFAERTRIGHGKTVYNELIRVPLIIINPFNEDMKGQRISTVVETRDIPTTILALADIKNTQFSGDNIMSQEVESIEQNGNIAFSEGSSSRSKGNLTHGIIYDQWKLIKNLTDNTYELYDMENDPGEKINLIESEKKNLVNTRKDLLSKMNSFKKQRLVELQKVEFTDEEVERLKALGYIQ